ncbi:MAG: aquaporin family protein [Firmicutes bacterium]|nr:aquaporin family protein [Bacillota bacterium]
MNVFMPYLGEFVGTCLLVLLGDGVVANVILKKTKGHGSGWIVITVGWATAVVVPALIFGGNGFTNHFNPALTLSLALTGQFALGKALGYVVAQFVGGFLGAVLVWFMHKDHFAATAMAAVKDNYVAACEGFCSIDEMRQLQADEDKAKATYQRNKADSEATMLAVFCTGPAIRKKWLNFCCEVIATFVLLFALAAGLANASNGEELHGAYTLWGVWMVILALGMSLGGTTGYSLNPARDLAPRLAHQILPIKGKGKSDWGYAWIPTVGPLVGAILGCIVSIAMFSSFAPVFW